MKKQYTKIAGTRIAYKGNIDWSNRHIVLSKMLDGVISDVLPNGGWWIISKYNV